MLAFQHLAELVELSTEERQKPNPFIWKCWKPGVRSVKLQITMRIARENSLVLRYASVAAIGPLFPSLRPTKLDPGGHYC